MQLLFLFLVLAVVLSIAIFAIKYVVIFIAAALLGFIILSALTDMFK